MFLKLFIVLQSYIYLLLLHIIQSKYYISFLAISDEENIEDDSDKDKSYIPTEPHSRAQEHYTSMYSFN